MEFLFRPNGLAWKLLQDDPDRYIYEAVRKGVDIPLPDAIAAGINDVSKRDGWNRPADPEFALPTETWREHVARRTRCFELRQKLTSQGIHSINDLITYNLDIRQLAQDVIENCFDPELLWAFYQAISQITVLDPTCGSGAFLFAALNVLEPLYDASLERMQAFLDEGEHVDGKYAQIFQEFRQILQHVAQQANRRYFILKSIIINNLYGVDIMEEATEICKLRLFLKLVAQVEPDTDKPNYGLEPLPDIDFNIRAGNTLVGFANYDEVKKVVEGEKQKKLDLFSDMEQINKKAQAVDQTFQDFHKLQTKERVEGSVTAQKKAELRSKLQELRGELDRYLADEYETGQSKKPAVFKKWRESHQPFHWFVEFYGIIDRGGFDVVLGNPPYVTYGKVKELYQIKGYVTESSSNLFAFTLERAKLLLIPKGRLGMIVPMSLVSTNNMSEASKLLLDEMDEIYFSHYSGNRNPSVLFEGVEMRLTIVLSRNKEHNNSDINLFTTNFLRWNAEARVNLFSTFFNQRVFVGQFLNSSLPKISTPFSEKILKKIFSKKKRIIDFIDVRSANKIYAHRIASYFVKCFDFIPFFRNERDGIKKSEDYKVFSFSSKEESSIASTIINSTLFYFFFITYSDTYHCGRELLLSFPIDIDHLEKKLAQKLIHLNYELMEDFQKKSFRSKIQYRGTGWVEFDKFYPKKSKDIIDKIDCILAQHYGFTDEELDFIINYDIKYRMGRDSEDED